jgi:predicted DNA-binding mobile mystery protein A
MSKPELAGLMGISASRVDRLERDELDGGLRLRSLERAAEALGCTVCYVLVPRDSLEEMVRRQARHKAARIVTPPTLPSGAHDECEVAEIVTEQIEALAYELIDRRGLWAIT